MEDSVPDDSPMRPSLDFTPLQRPAKLERIPSMGIGSSDSSMQTSAIIDDRKTKKEGRSVTFVPSKLRSSFLSYNLGSGISKGIDLERGSSSSPGDPNSNISNDVHGMAAIVSKNDVRMSRNKHSKKGKKEPRFLTWLKAAEHHLFNSPVVVTRMVMMVLLVVVIAVLTFGSWYIMRHVYGSTTVKLSARMRQEYLYDGLKKLTSFLKENRRYTVTAAITAESELLDLNASRFSPAQLRNRAPTLVWPFFQASTHVVSTMRLLQLDGLMVAYTTRSGQNKILIANTSIPVGGNYSLVPWYMSSVGTYGHPVGSATQIPGFDYSKYDSFGMALRKPPGSRGLDIFIGRQGIPILQFGQLVRSPSSGDAVAVTMLSCPLVTLGRILENDHLLGGYMYVSLANGMLLAVSSGISTVHNDSGRWEIINATDVNNLVVSQAAKFLVRQAGLPLLSNKSLNYSDVTINGTKYYISTKPFQFERLSMFMVVFTPRSATMGGIDRDNHHIQLLLILGSLGVLILGWTIILGLTFYVAFRMRPKEELLRQQEETRRAQAASEVKSQFLANISHDLRTPMAGIIGLLDIMLTERLSAEQEANLRQMKLCASSLLGLLNNLLDLAKVEAGKMQLESLEFNIVGELESLVDMFSVQGLSNGTEIALDLSDDFEHTVKGDPSRVRQVFANLLSNACKFTKEGHVLVRGWMKPDGPTLGLGSMIANPPSTAIRGPRGSIDPSGQQQQDEQEVEEEVEVDEGNEQNDESDDHEGDWETRHQNFVTFIFEVDDTGPGIPASKRGLVFEKFQQADLTTHRTHGGTGLGLGIVRSLVRLMRGYIAVVDKQGPGACFRFDLTFERMEEGSSWKRNISTPDFLMPKLTSIEGGQVLLAMSDKSAGAAIATAWMQRRGLSVRRATQWDELLPAVKHMVSIVQGSSCSSVSGSGVSGGALDKQELRSWVERNAGSDHNGYFSAGSFGMGQSEPLPSTTPFTSAGCIAPREKKFLSGAFAYATWQRQSHSSGRNSSGKSLLGEDLRSGGDVPSSSARLTYSWGGSRSSGKIAEESNSSMRVDSAENPTIDAAPIKALSLVIIDVALVPDSFHFFADELSSFLHRLQKWGLVVAWLVEHTTPPETRRALRAAGCQVASKPLYASRMAPLLALATSRKSASQSWSHTASTDPGSAPMESRTLGAVDCSNPNPLPQRKGPAETWAEEAMQTLGMPEGFSSNMSGSEVPWASLNGIIGRHANSMPACSCSGIISNSAVNSQDNPTYRPLQSLPKESVVRPTLRRQSSAPTMAKLVEGRPPPSPLIRDVELSGNMSNGKKSSMLSNGPARGGRHHQATASAQVVPAPSAQAPKWEKYRAVNSSPDFERELNGVDAPESGRIHRAQSRQSYTQQYKDRQRIVGQQLSEGGHDNALAGRHVLIAEDTALLKKVAVIRMQKLGCSVVTVSNGQEAVDAVLATYNPDGEVSKLFDAVLMDCQMPILDGYSATAAIRVAEQGTDRHIPIIALTAHAMTSDKKKCLDAGMDAYLTKPIDPALMALTILQLTSGQSIESSMEPSPAT